MPSRNIFLKVYKQRERKQLEIILTNMMDCMRCWNETNVRAVKIIGRMEQLFISRIGLSPSLCKTYECDLRDCFNKLKVLLDEFVVLQNKLYALFIVDQYDNCLMDEMDGKSGELTCISLIDDLTNITRMVELVVRTLFERSKCQYDTLHAIVQFICEFSNSSSKKLGDISQLNGLKNWVDRWLGMYNPLAHFYFNVNQIFKYFIDIYC